MSMGKRICSARKSKGFTQEYIAEQLHVSRQAVSKWEKDLTAPDTKNLIALAGLLNVSVEYLTIGAKESEASKSNISGTLLKISFCLLLLCTVFWLVGLFSGVYAEMVCVGGIGIPFLMYGDSPAAIVLIVLSAVCFFAAIILTAISFKLHND